MSSIDGNATVLHRASDHPLVTHALRTLVNRRHAGDSYAGRLPVPAPGYVEPPQYCDKCEKEHDSAGWSMVSLGELIDHVVVVHHSLLKRELPQLCCLCERLEMSCQDCHAVIDGLCADLGALRSEMEAHMMKEEAVLFPMIRQLEQSGEITGASGGSLATIIRILEAEHDNAVQALSRIQEALDKTAVLGEQSPIQTALREGVSALMADLDEHIHEEADFLFPRALALSASPNRHA